jgi:hypothetical protein
MSSWSEKPWWAVVALLVVTLVGNGAYWNWKELQLNTVTKIAELRNSENSIYRDIVELSEKYIAAQRDSVGKANDPGVVASIRQLQSQLDRRKADFTALEKQLARLESRQPEPLTIFFPTPQPVVVMPTALAVGGGEWKRTGFFEVRNRSETDTVYYSVWIKLWIEDHDVPGNLKVVSDKGEEFAAIPVAPGVSINPDVMRFVGKDVRGLRVIYLLLYRLDPCQAQKFIVNVQDEQAGVGNNDMNLSLVVKGFEDKPTAIDTKPDAVAIQFSPPESTSIEQVDVLVKREQ